MFRKISATVALLVPFILVAQGRAIVSWDANSEPDLAGYKIYVSDSTLAMLDSPHDVTGGRVIDVGLVLRDTVDNLANGQAWYFAVTAYDTAFNESGLSDVVSHFIPAPEPKPAIMVDGLRLFGGIAQDGDTLIVIKGQTNLRFAWSYPSSELAEIRYFKLRFTRMDSTKTDSVSIVSIWMPDTTQSPNSGISALVEPETPTVSLPLGLGYVYVTATNDTLESDPSNRVYYRVIEPPVAPISIYEIQPDTLEVGDILDILGDGFDQVQEVFLGGNQMPAFQILSPNLIRLVVPQNTVSGYVSVFRGQGDPVTSTVFLTIINKPPSPPQNFSVEIIVE